MSISLLRSSTNEVSIRTNSSHGQSIGNVIEIRSLLVMKNMQTDGQVF
jgi:hypothetical protein